MVNLLVVHAAITSIDLYIRVFEATNTRHSTKVVVESTILLHKQDDMFDVCY